ncbi:hypothetical protein IWW35_006617, partial [Coemansia sp. RSA 1878]
MTPWLPEILRNPLAALIGEPCTKTLVDELNIFDPLCLRHAVSKGLGLGIVLGGCIVKLPQLFKILNAKSVAGISLSSYVLEVLANAITLAYNFRQGYSFTTYGEALFIGVQNIAITLLILAFTGRTMVGIVTSTLLLAFAYVLFDTSLVNGSLLSV